MSFYPNRFVNRMSFTQAIPPFAIPQIQWLILYILYRAAARPLKLSAPMINTWFGSTLNTSTLKQMHKKKVVIISLVFLLSIPCAAQINHSGKEMPSSTCIKIVDSLFHLADQHLSVFLKGGSRRITDTVAQLAGKAFRLADSIQYQKGIGESLLIWGKSLVYNEGHKYSLELLTRALPLLQKMNDTSSIAACMKLLAEDYHATGAFIPAIAYYDSAKIIYQNLNDSSNTIYCIMMKGHCNYDLGNYKEAYTYCDAAYIMAAKSGNKNLQILSGANLCNLFLGAELPQNTIDYMHQVMQVNPINANTKNVKGPMRWVLILGGDAFLKLNKTDSAAALSQLLNPFDSADVEETLFRGLLAVAEHQQEKALVFFETGYRFSLLHNHPIAVARHASEMARTWLTLKNYKLAVLYASEALKNAEQIHALKEVKIANGVLTDIYGVTKDYAKAWYYGKRYKSISDSLVPDEYRRVLAMIQVLHELSNQKQAVQALSKENLLKESRLSEERMMRNASVAAMIAILAIGILVVRNINLKKNKDRVQHLMEETSRQLENRKKEQKLVELEREKTDLEMQALRAQMNPHFIFNCLSSINRFILKNETEAASDYLTKFSRLIRMVLINSKNTFIVLEDELEMLRLYLDMERLRFRESFDYSIHLTNSIDLRSLFIPPLLLQPFAENAIWHGLMHKEGPGKLTIELGLKKNILYCVITDNGIGRVKAAEMKTKFMEKEKSLGLQITAERLALLNKDIDEPVVFDIQDLQDENGNAAGTKVTIKIHCEVKSEMHKA